MGETIVASYKSQHELRYGTPLDAHKCGSRGLHAKVQLLAYDRPVEAHANSQIKDGLRVRKLKARGDRGG